MPHQSQQNIGNNNNNNLNNSIKSFTNAGNHHNTNNINNNSNTNGNSQLCEGFQAPKHQLCDPNLVKLDWLQSEKIGGGLINVGNTCFLNSVLQCLTYCPPLYNFLVKLNGGHSNTCKINQFCMLCEMEKHIKRIKNSNGTPIKPISIVQRLKYINKSFQFGRQEDAHEFLRYIIDHMWKACLMNLDINSKTTKLDPRIKETTFINHIFGGYHRSQVLCLSCNSRSNTFDFFMDFILDIRSAKSLEEALKKFTQPETLENENAYKCSKCRKKVVARKRFSVYKAPNVATFQLKRFDSDRIFGGKVTKFVSYPEELDLRPYMSDSSKSPIKYQLSAVLVHVGHSSNSGHYFCFIKNSNGFWYRMDDSNVSVVNKNLVLQQQAYVLFYTRKVSDIKPSPSTGVEQEKNNSNVCTTNNATTASMSMNSTTACNNNIINNGATKTNSTTQQQPETATPASASISTSATTTTTTSTATITTNSTASTTTTITSTAQSSTNSVKTSQSFLATWLGTKSKLDEEDSSKRKLNEITDRDKFNEELDQGKTKKIKSHSRDERFANLSKTNPFQRFTSNGYQQYNNNNANKQGANNIFQKHNGRQNKSHGLPKHNYLKSINFRRYDSHKHKFSHEGKQKGRHFIRRQ